MGDRDESRRDAIRRIGNTVAGVAGAASLGGWVMPTSPAKLITRPIHSSGEQLPVVGIGTWQTFDVGSSTAERRPLEEVVSAFVELGGKIIDSSPMYGASEDVVGQIVEKLGVRSKLFIATKVWISGKAAGIEQMHESMQKLRVKQMDLMQVHNLVDVDTHLATLADWKREGRVRYVGVTHYTAGSHNEVARVMEKHELDFIQINYSVGEREAELRLLPLAKERGVAVIANRPFAGGDLFRRLRSKPLPAFAAELDCDSWAQLLLKFVISHPAMTCAIPGTSKAAHLRDNMKAATGRLPDEALRKRIIAAAV